MIFMITIYPLCRTSEFSNQPLNSSTLDPHESPRQHML
jgi:hypothetical protein